jgi:hypothetical protein
MPDDVEPVDAAYRAARCEVPQGCTGLWQIGRDAEGMPHEAPHYDFYYLRHRSIRLDAWVLWRTALLMMGFGSPVALEHVPAWAVAPARQPNAGTFHTGASFINLGSDVAA